ncbi:ABC transporter permease subunit [Alicyclobacillus sp. SO9]|uniref:ABC transporter permease subunit n=1 Tax=Alicyclobacillus sp. SO9 TaxID=2665646 RepID=UPI001938BE32|nr:ABC transporter permease subunit [Alicyclobacillus sp. SO9]QQE79922.1 ABC transporter permease [Alicyclobacillus sp. SO9]
MRWRATGGVLALVALLCVSFLLLPLAALLLHIPWSSLWQVWSSEGASALRLSLMTAVISMAVIVVFGTPLGWLLARGRSRLWQWVEYLMLIPLLMPPLVLGLLLIYFYGPYGTVGKFLGIWHLSATNTALAVVIAQIYESIPYYVFSAQGAFHQVDAIHEQISWSLGVGPWKTFRQITLPLALPGMTVGFMMAFARAVGAFGAVVVVAYYPHTLPISVWIALQEKGLPTALPLALLLLLISMPLPLAAVLWRRLHA